MSESTMTPREIVHELDKHVIGQDKPKRFVSIAMRNRWRRMQLTPELREEVMPKNILMIGPTGVGKTEIARRLAKLSNAPFIKVEATKFTEVGYVGRDVESIIRDLMEVAVKLARENAKTKVEEAAHEAAYEKILDVLVPPLRPVSNTSDVSLTEEDEEAAQFLLESQEAAEKENSAARKQYREQLLAGELDDQEIDIELDVRSVSMEIMGPPGMEDMTQQLQDLFQNIGGQKKKERKLTIKEAFKSIKDEEAEKLVNEDDIKVSAVDSVEQNGIVFIDEIDKVCRRNEAGGSGEVSREGVQRDLLPLVEGSTVSTKYGMIKTDHILFIASGAFHVAKPSDIIPELQGRFPIRVELEALEVKDFIRILTEPDASLIEQYVALMATEGYTISFTKGAIKRLAEIAWHVNEKVENIGARRLHTVLEKLLEEISFEASDRSGKSLSIDVKYVDKVLADLVEDEDLRRYIL